MVRTLVAAGFLAVILLGASPVSAQTGRNELTVFAGISLASPETGQPGGPWPVPLGTVGRITAPGPVDFQRIGAPTILVASLQVTRAMGASGEFGARYSRYLNDRITLDGDFSIAPAHSLTTTYRWGCPPGLPCILGADAVRLVAPDAFLSTRVVAYHYGTGLGIDLLRGAVRPALLAGVGAATYDAEGLRTTAFTTRVGGALKAGIGRLTARVEVLDVISADHFVTDEAEHDLHVRVGLGVGW